MSDAPAENGHYDETPGAKKTPSRAMTTWQDFEGELQQREHEIASILPSNLSPERFKNWAISAVKQNPELLECTPRSLFQAITRSAQDGILPDGREGVIQPYNTKVKKRGVEVWEKHAQWNPMAFGLRKRARELDALLIDTQVVYEKDKFIWHQGDEPSIEHEPAPLGTDRGKMIGAYAIFKREDKTIVAREVMDSVAINTVREQSKSPDGLMWKKFTTEAWRKTVLRRGIKSVPVSEGLQDIIKRDDEANFDFTAANQPAQILVPPPAPRVEFTPSTPVPQAEARTAEPISRKVEEELDRGQLRAMRGEPEVEVGSVQWGRDTLEELNEIDNPADFNGWYTVAIQTGITKVETKDKALQEKLVQAVIDAQDKWNLA